jgi:hypothetical protein
MNILLATDAFPPVCGGSGWSTYELAAGLRARGHTVTIARPRVNRRGIVPDAGETTEYDGFRPVEYQSSAPGVPFVRNYFKNERLWTSFGTFLAGLVGRHGVDIIHAQHVLTGPAAIAAGRAAGVPVVCTIRDYWPICYWSDLVYDTGASDTCPACTVSGMVRCLQGRGGPAWPAAICQKDSRSRSDWAMQASSTTPSSSRPPSADSMRSRSRAWSLPSLCTST